MEFYRSASISSEVHVGRKDRADDGQLAARTYALAPAMTTSAEQTKPLLALESISSRCGIGEIRSGVARVQPTRALAQSFLGLCPKKTPPRTAWLVPRHDGALRCRKCLRWLVEQEEENIFD